MSLAQARDGAAQDWRRGAAIYQIYPSSFCDSNGDGVGDLPGITSRLDHVASLGVDGIWLSPFFVSPMADFGYDIADLCDVDPVFGTLADFDALVAKAHRLGLKVVIDQVYGHLSDRHAWFAESRASRDNPRADWFVWADAKPDGAPPNNWQSAFHGPAWTWDAGRGQYYLHNFLAAQPDLNLHNPKVQEALLEVARFWLARGVDGFRLDAVNFLMHDPGLADNPPAPADWPRRSPFDFQLHRFNQSHAAIPAFLERVQALVDEGPGRLSVAEVGGQTALEEMRAYTRGPQRLCTAYGFDFLYADCLTADGVRQALESWQPEAEPGAWPSWAFSNHDAPRAPSRWWPDTPTPLTAPLALLLLACLRGNIFLYQGEELGLPQAQVPRERLRDPEALANWPRTLGRDGARTPMPWNAAAPHAGFSCAEPWLPVDPRHAALAVDRQEAQAGSVLAFARRALALRRERRELREGELAFLPAADGVLVFERTLGAARSVCVFNLTAEAQEAPPPPGARLLLATDGASLAGPPPSRLEPLQGYVASV